MDHFAGLDVSVKETSVCIVDDTGKIVREVKVASEPEALLVVLKNPSYRFKRIGLEAGPLSQWLFGALAEAGLPVICVETRQMRAVLKAQINKTDRNDARGMAQMMRVGLYRPVHVKTLRSQKLRMLLTHRKLLQSKAIAIDNDLLRSELEKAGFSSVMIETKSEQSRAPSPRHAAVAYCQGTPLRNEIEARDAEKLEAAIEYAASKIAHEHGSGEVFAKIQAHIIVAVV